MRYGHAALPSPRLAPRPHPPHVPPRSEEGPKIRFRNHQPRSESLQELTIENAVAPKVDDEVGTAEVIHNDATQEPLLNLAPKRPNWDLKRDLEPQLKKLRHMTDRAIVGLIAARVAEEAEKKGGGDGPDLASAVSRVQKASGDASDED